MLMISNEIERLCSKLDIHELKKWFDNLIPILEHNKNKLLYDDVIVNNQILKQNLSRNKMKMLLKNGMRMDM